ncbi:hypothetical protein WKV53_27755 [Luteolibacter sp. Y139]|uniref:Uncharacterized protein n=1 Tax=Luteolibacter soli TaxID=3135280 RepID=A0ABU9B2T2_9BACT
MEIESDGRRWLIARSAIECGLEYLTVGGQWVNEGDPLFRDLAFRELREIRASFTTTAAVALRARELAHILRRNGWSVPGWCKDLP